MDNPFTVFFRNVTVLCAGFICLLYILNPAPEQVGLISNSIPYVGHLDVVLATGLFLGCLRYTGIDLVGAIWPPLSPSEEEYRGSG